MKPVDLDGDILTDGHYPLQRGEADLQGKKHTLHDATRKASAVHDTNCNSARDFPTSLAFLVNQHLNAGPTDIPMGTSRVMASLLDTIHILQGQVDSLGKRFKTDRAQFEDDPPRSQNPHFQVLHRVFCDKTDHCHNRVVYRDQPRFERDIGWGSDEVLRGSEPIYNVESYLNQSPATRFVVFQEHRCIHGQKSKDTLDENRTHETNTISHRAERMWILLPELQKALLDAMQPDPRGRMRHTPQFSMMDAPYDFLFHHHQQLISMAENDSAYKVALEPLLRFLADNYQAEFDGAKEQFNQGLVSTKNLGKLFHPNQIIIARNSKTRAARGGIISLCDSLESGGISLRGWSWKYDGLDLIRTRWKGSMGAPAVEPIPVLDLPIYPFDFATDEEKQHLENRGKKFWSMREKAYASYSGWDAHRRQSYVSSMPLLIKATSKLIA